MIALHSASRQAMVPAGSPDETSIDSEPTEVNR
jgi:hypothetical protein